MGYFRAFCDSVVFFLLHFLILILTSLHLYGNITILFNHSTVVLEIIKYLINSSIYTYLVYICNLNSFEIIQLFKHIYYIKISDYLEIKIRWVPHVEQLLLTLPEHLISPPVLSDGRVARPLAFWALICKSLFVMLSFFRLAIALSILLRLTASEYPFGIFKLFSSWVS